MPPFQKMKAEIAVLSTSILPFLPSLSGDFVFDDWESVVNNPVVTGKLSISEIWNRDFWGRPLSSPQSHKSFRPLTTLLFRILWSVFDEKPYGFHVVNVLLHAVVSLLVLRVFRRLETRWNVKNSVAVVAGIAFSVHPVHTEAIANVTGCAELLSSLWVSLGLSYFLKQRENMNTSALSATFAFSLAAVLSKEQGISLLPICASIAFIEKRHSHFFIMCLLSVATVWFRWRIGGMETPKFTVSDNPAAFVEDPFLRWISFVWQWLLHIQLLVLPLQMCFDYSMGCVPPFSSLKDHRLLLLLFSMVSGLFALQNVLRRLQTEHQRMLIFSIVLGGISFFPASNIPVTVGFSVAERVLYLPSIGYCLLLATLLQKLKKVWKIADSSVFFLFVLAVSQSYQRSFEWKTEFSLYSSGLRVCPSNPKIHYNLAKVLADQGHFREAEERYRSALRLHPDYEQALNNLGNLLEKEGRLNEAEKLLRAAVEVRPDFASAWMNLGITTMNAGKFNESISAFQESLERRPRSADCFFNLGNLYQKMGDLGEAIRSWQNAIRIDATHTASWTNLLVALDEKGRCSEVVRLSPTALQHVPFVASVRSQIGVCFAQLGFYKEAKTHLTEAVRISPHNSMYKANYDALQNFVRQNRTIDG